MYFHPKLAWPPANYDVTSHNHNNWRSLNLSQNLHEGWTNRYWKQQVLMFYPSRKKRRKTLWRGGGGHPPCLVCLRVKTTLGENERNYKQKTMCKSIFFWPGTQNLRYNNRLRMTWEYKQGLKKVPPGYLGQVVFGFRHVAFLASVPDGQGYGQATAFNRFKKSCEK